MLDSNEQEAEKRIREAIHFARQHLIESAIIWRAVAFTYENEDDSSPGVDARRKATQTVEFLKPSTVQVATAQPGEKGPEKLTKAELEVMIEEQRQLVYDDETALVGLLHQLTRIEDREDAGWWANLAEAQADELSLVPLDLPETEEENQAVIRAWREAIDETPEERILAHYSMMYQASRYPSLEDVLTQTKVG